MITFSKAHTLKAIVLWSNRGRGKRDEGRATGRVWGKEVISDQLSVISLTVVSGTRVEERSDQ